MAIPNSTITHHHQGEIKAEFKASMRSEDFAHLANLLVNLYSDPIEAIIREYSTNALDAHIEVGNTDPIRVTLPTSANPTFSVQDFGTGLSIDDLRDVYSMYGRSTKRNSNDVTGQLGVGCKSGLTYADAFTITAVKDGVKCVAMSTKDERGLGTIRVIDTVASTEGNSVRIDIPVKSYDINEFHSTAVELFQFWSEGTVLVDGKAPEVPEWRKQGLFLDDDTLVIPHNAGLHTSYVVMGNVAYEVPDAQYGPSHNRTHRRFVARINMGDVDFVPSREAVHFTPHTRETLTELTDYIATHFNRVLNDRLSQCASRWDETQLKVLWKGSQMRVNASQQLPIWEYLPTAYQRKGRAHTSYRFDQLMKTSTVIITNFPNKSLSPVHRDRLVEMVPGCKQFVVIPKGCDVSGLPGRDAVYTWDDVLGATDEPVKGKRQSRGKRDETRYATMGGPSYTAAELNALGTKVLYMMPRDHSSLGNLDCTVVMLYSSTQLNRLQRLVPGIKLYWTELAERQQAVKDAITDNDRRIVAAQRLHNSWAKIDPSEIIDTDLAEAIRMSKAPSTDTMEAARKMGITVQPMNGDVNRLFAERYPLLDPSNQYYASRLPNEDMVMYINAKYPSIAAQNLSDEMDYEISEDSLDALAS